MEKEFENKVEVMIWNNETHDFDKSDIEYNAHWCFRDFPDYESYNVESMSCFKWGLTRIYVVKKEDV